MHSKYNSKASEESDDKSNSKDKPKPQSYIIEHIVSLHGVQNLKKYIKHELLGRGGFANCYVTECMTTKELMATKVINKSNMKSNRSRLRLINEIKIHKTFKHPNIVQYLHHFEDYDNVYIMLELCQNESLNELLKERKTLSYPEIQSFLYGICNGVKYLHDMKYIHRDLKLGNIFLNKKFQIKIGDFGLTSQLEFLKENKRTVCGTPNYIAPEILEGVGYYFEVDIWAIGIIIYTLFYGFPPFESEQTPEIYNRIRRCDYSFPKLKSVPAEAVSLIRSILVPNPEKRPSIEEILDSPFMHLGNGIPLQLPAKCATRVPTRNELDAMPHLSLKENVLKEKKLSKNNSLQNTLNNLTIEADQKSKNDNKSTMDKTVSRQGNLLLTGIEIDPKFCNENQKSSGHNGLQNHMQHSIVHKKTMSSMPTAFKPQEKVVENIEEEEHLIEFEQIDDKTFYFCTSKYSIGIYEKDRDICFRHVLDFQRNLPDINQVKLYNNLFSELGSIPINSFKNKALISLKAKEVLKAIRKDTLLESLPSFQKENNVKSPEKLVFVSRVSQHKQTTMVKLSNKCIQVLYYPDNHGFFYNTSSQKLFHYNSLNDKQEMKELEVSSIGKTVNKYNKNNEKSTKVPNIQTFVPMVGSNQMVKIPMSNLLHIYSILSELETKKKHIRGRNSQ